MTTAKGGGFLSRIKGYENLVNELRSSTSKGLIQWSKGEGQFAYEFFAHSRKFLVDKYYSVFNGRPNTCFSMTIFDSDKIVDELVSCKIDGLDGEFKILKDLYEVVEKAIDDKRSENYLLS